MRPVKTIAGLLTAALIGCSGQDVVMDEPPTAPRENRNTEDMGSIFGEEGLALSLFGAPDAEREGGGAGIGVNSYLWRASLDTVSFMPISDADPFGGVILTDWHNPAETPGERFKLNVYILDRQLRADGIRVAVFRQVRNEDTGEWEDARVAEGTASALEDTILTRARQLRVDSAT
jgi:hypothetical protein